MVRWRTRGFRTALRSHAAERDSLLRFLPLAFDRMTKMSRNLKPETAPRVQRTWAQWISWIATEDHCEWANCYVATVKTPLGVLVVGALCSLLCGLFVAPQGYVLLAAIVAVIVIGLAWPLVGIRGIRCRIVFESRRGREGQAAPAKLIVTNRWPWPVWGLSVADPVRPDDPDAWLALARVEGWSSATFKCAFTPALRGVYPDREVRVSTGFPFGLYQASRQADVSRSLLVWPQTFWLPPIGLEASRPHWRGATTDGRVGRDGIRLGVREHRVGDSLRDVHWAKSARYDRLVVSEREASTVESVCVFVPINQPSEQDPTLEWRLRIAASVCESFAASQGRVELTCGGHKLGVGHSSASLVRLFDELAQFDATEGVESPRRATRTSDSVAIMIDAEGGSIVLRRSDLLKRAPYSGASNTRWIEADSLGDVPGQVLRGWRAERGKTTRVG